MKKLLVMGLSGLIALGSIGVAQDVASRPSVGAIRWDAWTGGEITTVVEHTLAPKKYHFRLPWFAEVNGDDSVRIDGSRPGVMEQEIDFAARAGLDYWAFVLYPESSSMSRGLELYRRSAQRKHINFCMILHATLGVPAAQWPHERDRMLKLLREPGYQTVLDGRPLIYAFQMGGEASTVRFAELLRHARAARVNPYCVYMGWEPVADFRRESAHGFDAVSAYACGSADDTFAQLCQRVETRYWRRAAAARIPFVPFVSTGWDKRPRQDHPVPWEKNQPYHTQKKFPSTATPEEIASHLNAALRVAREDRQLCAADTLIIYAWNEHDEGGWLAPTWTPGGKPDTGRIDALARVLRPAGTAAR